VSTLAGAAGQEGSADGLGAAARFCYPTGVALCPDGSLLVADEVNNTIRSVSAEGQVSTVAGAAGQEGSTDGPAALARFNEPCGLSLGSDGSLYIADSSNHTIRCLSPGGTVRTVAGAAEQEGSADGIGPAAQFNKPSGLAAAPDGRLYVADTDNHTIRCISAAGVVSTLAGAAGQEGSTDGQGAAARFSSPWGIAVGPDGSLYVADWENRTIRCISAEGAVSTLAGAAEQKGAMDGRGSAARLSRPTGLAVGPDGSLYITDWHSVRRIT
jgi:DNA-binding beta-propeller fold protein YncE